MVSSSFMSSMPSTDLPWFDVCAASAPPQSAHLLGCINYLAGDGVRWQPLQADGLHGVPAVDVPLKGHLGIAPAQQWRAGTPHSAGPRLPALPAERACAQLRCYSPSPVRAGQWGTITYRESADVLFAGMHIPLPPSGACTEAVQAGYAALFELLEHSGKRTMVRIWNYVPRITQTTAHGTEIYRDFNLGRSQAFDTSGYDTRHMPAATGIGCEGNHIAVAVLASTDAGVNFENPRQVAAYRYPSVHGPRPPSFARATAWPHDAPQWLLVSGTASIIGHQTVHIDDVHQQARLALDNVRLLLDARGATLADIDMLTLYVRHARDVAMVAPWVAQQLRADTQLLVTQADICRSDLLVEMEALARKR